jgi:hypothetical protein
VGQKPLKCGNKNAEIKSTQAGLPRSLKANSKDLSRQYTDGNGKIKCTNGGKLVRKNPDLGKSNKSGGVDTQIKRPKSLKKGRQNLAPTVQRTNCMM